MCRKMAGTGTGTVTRGAFYSLVWALVLMVCFGMGVERERGGAELELEVLMEMKEAMDPRGEVLQSWQRAAEPCSFEGVACNEVGQVVNVSLQGKALSGIIPTAVSKLRYLTGLYLHYNNLHGTIPAELSRLPNLLDLYLNVNMLSGSIPAELGSMPNLQALQLCCNSLAGPIPRELGGLKKLSVLALQHNGLTGAVPASVGSLISLTRLDLSYNSLFGPIPITITKLPHLTTLDVSNNNLSGRAPQGLKRMQQGFKYGNNSKLCGEGFSGLQKCTSEVIKSEPLVSEAPPHMIDNAAKTNQQNLPESANLASKTKASSSNTLRGIPFILGAVILICLGILGSGFTFLWFRRSKQKISGTFEVTEGRPSIDNAKDTKKNGVLPLISLDYSSGLILKFNLEVIEFATQHFSEKNLLGKNDYCATYKGSLRDGSRVVVKRISISSCKTEEEEFHQGLKLLYLLRHENVVRLKGFCCSTARGECFLVYDFVPNGSLLQYLDTNDITNVLDWSSRVTIARGIGQAIGYLHEGTSKAVIHENISAKKVLLDTNMNAVLSDCGLHKLLADDIIYSIRKASAGMGCLAPEYTTMGRATDRSDIYAFGVILFQLLTGRKEAISVRPLLQCGSIQDIIDINLAGNYSKVEASNLASIALHCTHEVPSQRPSIAYVMQQFTRLNVVIS